MMYEWHVTRDHGLDSGHHVPGLGGNGPGGEHELCPHILCLLHVAQSQPRYDWSLINLVFIPGHQSINQNQLVLFVDDVTFKWMKSLWNSYLNKKISKCYTRLFWHWKLIGYLFVFHPNIFNFHCHSMFIIFFSVF